MKSLPALVLAAAAATTLAVAQDATKLSKEELLGLMPEAKIHHVNQYGSTRYWTNGKDGTFTASSDSKKYSSSGTYSTGRGEWNISDDGMYCVRIEWKRDSEKWCAFVWRTADGYALGKDGPKSPIEVTK